MTDTIYWMNKAQTDPQLSSTMINWIIDAGQKSFVDCVPDNAMPLLRDAAQQQDAIGPTSFIAGKISLLWERVQLQYEFESNIYKGQHRRSWNTDMIKNSRLLMKRIWKGRNDVVHEDGVY